MIKGILKMIAKIRNNFLTGVFTFLPLVLTSYLVFILVLKINGLVLTITPKQLHQFVLDDTYGILVRLLIVMILLILITILGFLTKLYIGREFLRAGDRLITRIPVLNKIYSTITQISKAMFGQKEKIFKKVVLVEYPRRGIYSLGFKTGVTKGEVQVKTSEESCNVFIPTTPNPTSGMLVMVPEKEIMYMDMTVEEGMKLIISGGAVTPDYKMVSGE